MYIAGSNNANTNGYDIYSRVYGSGITDCNDPSNSYSDVLQSGLAAAGACTCTSTACTQNQGYNQYTVSSTGLPLLNYYDQNQFVFPFTMVETFTTATCTDTTKRQLIVISPGTCTTGTSACSTVTYNGVSVGKDYVCTNSPTPTSTPSLRPVVGSITTSGFMQLSVYTSSPCTGLPVGYQYKQLGVCSCAFGFCVMLTAINNAATGTSTFITKTWGTGPGGTIAFDCTGTPANALQSVNSTSCMSITSAYGGVISFGDWSVSNSNLNGAFLAVPKLITVLPPVQSGMIATYGYNSQAGCTAATTANIADVVYQNAACTKDYSTSSGNFWYTNYCPSTTAPQAVTRYCRGPDITPF